MNTEKNILSKVESYQNDSVVRRFCWTFGESLDRGHFVFNALKRMLWLFAERHHDHARGGLSCPPAPILRSMWALDEMWHAFILHTVEYHEFCQDYLGMFIHHVPEDKQFEGEPEDGVAEIWVKRQLHGDSYFKAVDYITRKLSEHDAWLWFVEIPRQFPSPKIHRT